MGPRPWLTLRTHVTDKSYINLAKQKSCLFNILICVSDKHLIVKITLYNAVITDRLKCIIHIEWKEDHNG